MLGTMAGFPIRVDANPKSWKSAAVCWREPIFAHPPLRHAIGPLPVIASRLRRVCLTGASSHDGKPPSFRLRF